MPASPARPALSVVVPLYDEARRLQAGLEGLAWLRRLHPGPVEALLVDDGSTDTTLALARAAEDQHTRVLAEPHRGKGGAVRAGLLAATGARVLVTDVDWSVSPPEVLRVLEVEGEVVVATREGRGARRLGEPWHRHLLGRVFNKLVQSALLAGHEDTQCGCKVLSAEVVADLGPRLVAEGWAYDVELLYLAHLRGWSVIERPVTWRHEVDSRLRPGVDALAMAREVLSIRRRARQGAYGGAPSGSRSR